MDGIHWIGGWTAVLMEYSYVCQASGEHSPERDGGKDIIWSYLDWNIA